MFLLLEQILTLRFKLRRKKRLEVSDILAVVLCLYWPKFWDKCLKVLFPNACKSYAASENTARENPFFLT